MTQRKGDRWPKKLWNLSPRSPIKFRKSWLKRKVFFQLDKSIWKDKGIEMRNAATTTIAPTGSISMVAEVSSGLEPNFAFSYQKSQVMGGKKFKYTNPYLEKELRERGLYSQELDDKISKTGSVQGVEEVPEDIQEVFVGATEISPRKSYKNAVCFPKTRR